MDFAVPEIAAFGAVGEIVAGRRERNRPIDSCTEIRFNLEFSSDASSYKSLVPLEGATARVAAIVSYGSAGVDEGSECQIPIRPSVDLLWRRAEVTE